MGHAKVIAITMPVMQGDAPGALKTSMAEGLSLQEAFIVYAARVSNPASQASGLNGKKLLKYLMAHQHWSPFEMVSVTVSITTTRDIARQILRHRSFSFQEFSQRYAEVTEIAPLRQARMQDHKNRQNSVVTDDVQIAADWEAAQRFAIETAQNVYKTALAAGIAKEVARAVLPEGLTVSNLYMAGTVRSWLHYLQLRLAFGTQVEHQVIAQRIQQELRGFFPNLMEYVNA